MKKQTNTKFKNAVRSGFLSLVALLTLAGQLSGGYAWAIEGELGVGDSKPESAEVVGEETTGDTSVKNEIVEEETTKDEVADKKLTEDEDVDEVEGAESSKDGSEEMQDGGLIEDDKKLAGLSNVKVMTLGIEAAPLALNVLGSGVCTVENEADLRDAIDDESCERIEVVYGALTANGLVIDSGVELDGKGKTVTVDSSNENMYVLAAGSATTVIKNLNVEAGTKGAIYIPNGIGVSSVVLEDVATVSENASSTDAHIVINECGVALTLNNYTSTGGAATVDYGCSSVVNENMNLSLRGSVGLGTQVSVIFSGTNGTVTFDEDPTILAGSNFAAKDGVLRDALGVNPDAYWSFADMTDTAITGDARGFVVADTTAPEVKIETVAKDMISGTINDVMAQIEVVIDGVVAGLATNHGDGTWSFAGSEFLDDIFYNIIARATDGNGNSADVDTTVRFSSPVVPEPIPEDVVPMVVPTLYVANEVPENVDDVDDTADDIEDDTTKDDDADEEEAESDEKWALLNLLITIAVAVAGVSMLAMYVKDKKSSRIAAIVLAVATVIVFLLTEDLGRPMVFADGWTLLMLLAAVAQVVIVARAKADGDE